MSRSIYCLKLHKEAEGLNKPPFPNPLGEKIYQNISREAFQLWLKQQTILINENHLKMNDPKAREFLLKEMEKFFFDEN
jgi:Fe-S cluster biosynthesis and repair protein YggX